MRNFVPAIVIALSNFLSPIAFSQISDPHATFVGVSRRYAPPEAAHRHSSTPYEGALRGEAAWITAAGEFLVDEAQSEILWQQVESLHYDNEIKKTAAALTRKKMLNDFRDYERQRRNERRIQSKELWQQKTQELARTYRLNEYEFNWETGAIYWPALVSSPRYAKHRERLDVLLARVVQYGPASRMYDVDEIATVCHDFRSQLKGDFEQDHPLMRQQYSDMQRFLLGLKYAPALMQANGVSQTLAMR